jgi:chemotaxis protein methyltransferase CheR
MRAINAELSDELYAGFRDLLLARCGLYYPERKRGDLAHGLNIVLEATSYRSLTELYGDAVAGGAAWEAILAQLTIGETYFFRNQAQFDALRQHILPELLARRAMTRTLRLWSAGCATGEEPYSLAIVLDQLLPRDDTWNISILATDINPHFLARAREALYSSWSFRQTPDELRDRYWITEQGRWRLCSDIRRMVSFARINLAEPGYPAITNGTSAIDIILCRNVTIYFDEATTRQVAQRFYSALMPGGWLIVGHAEPQADVYHPFKVHNFPDTILYHKPLDAPAFLLDSGGQPFDTSTQTLPRAAEQAPQAASPPPATYELPRPSHMPPAPANAQHQRPTAYDLASNARQHSDNLSSWAAITARLAQADTFSAEQLLIELLRTNPTHEQALIRLGRLYADRADWLRARQQCMLALEQHPLSIPAHYLLAQICEHQEEIEDALAAYRRTLYLDHTFVPGILGMANIWRRMGRPAQAQRYYRNALTHLDALPATTRIPEADNASAGELIALIARQLESLTKP